MIQFNEQEIRHLRQKAKEDPTVIERLEKACHTVFTRPILIPQTAVATWSLFYYCPKHSVTLQFDLDSPTVHRCPVDGETFSGEPYDGSWWCRRSGMNGGAAGRMAELYLLTEERRWADKAIAILEGYAQAYPGYEPHGGIPCNHPGKAFAQAITDADFVRQLAIAYDMLESAMTDAQKQKIRDGLFFPAADFLMEQRTPQLHNHEVIINSAIAAIGVLFGREDYIDFALNGKYGIYYQLDHAVLEDGFWFEGSVGYHFFTLKNLFSYAKFARHTPYSTLEHPAYLRMLHMTLKLLQPDGNYPCLNDMFPAQGNLEHYQVLEFAYAHYQDPVLLKALHLYYRDHPRDSLEAFFYGVDTLPQEPSPEVSLIPGGYYHNVDGSGITILRGSHQRYLLVKHGPYGGEHDHFDRLGVSFLSHGKRIIYDMGTTGYGAKMHYQYYKNTATHNTVSIDGANQPPSSGWVNGFEERADGIFLDIGTGWVEPYPLPDIFALKEWDEAIYQGVEMRRRILWAERYWIDLFTVEGADPERTIDYTLHFNGKRLTRLDEESPRGPLNANKPQCYLSGITGVEGKKALVLSEGKTVKAVPFFYDCDGVTAASYTFQGDSTMLFAQGPNNPGVDMIDYLIQRRKGGSGVFLTLTETYGEEGPMVKEVCARVENGEVVVTVSTVTGEQLVHRMA